MFVLCVCVNVFRVITLFLCLRLAVCFCCLYFLSISYSFLFWIFFFYINCQESCLANENTSSATSSHKFMFNLICWFVFLFYLYVRIFAIILEPFGLLLRHVINTNKTIYAILSHLLAFNPSTDAFKKKLLFF